MTWTGARVFDGRPVEPVYLVTGAVLWLLVCRLPLVMDSNNVRSLIISGIITAYVWLTAYEFWCGRSEALISRWPAIVMFFAHGALFLLRTPMIALLPPASVGSGGVYGSVWMTVLSFEVLLLTISSAFLLLAMAKERTELRHRKAAMVDPLTGIANRRSFLHDASMLAKLHIANPRPTAFLVIDLDHFKSINDRFGHAVGDRVLEIFTEAARKSMRGSDLVGRLGGEEFAAVLADTSREKAVAVAERIRDTFAQMAQEVDGHPVCGTVSIGLVHCLERTLDVTELLAQADHALYYAKERGRNRVEVASLDMTGDRKKFEAASTSSVGAISAKSAA
jgi:diguanylate cyclase (GGDEF)-like protein